MRASFVVASSLFGLLAVASFAQAGVLEDPEILDAADDSAHPAPGHDVAAFWIGDEIVDSEGGAALAFNLQLSGEIQHAPAFFAFHETIRVGFQVEKPTGVSPEQYVDFRPSRASVSLVVTSVPGPDPSLGCRYGVAANGAYTDIPNEVVLPGAFSGALYQCFLPVSQVGGFDLAADKVTGLYVLHRQIVRGPLSGGDQVPQTEVRVWDRAPDEGVGREFPATPAPPAAPEENVTETVNETAPMEVVDANATDTPDAPSASTDPDANVTSNMTDLDRSVPTDETTATGDDTASTPGLGVVIAPALAWAAWRRRDHLRKA